MAAIYDGVTSLLLALPAELVGAAQGDKLAPSDSPSLAHVHNLGPEAKADKPRTPSAAGSAPIRSSSQPAASKRVSWADEPRPASSNLENLRSPARRTDGEHPAHKRLLGIAAAEQTARVHVARARQVKASSSTSMLPDAPDGRKAYKSEGKGDLVVLYMF